MRSLTERPKVFFLENNKQLKHKSLLNLLPKLLTPDSFSPSRHHSNMYALRMCVLVTVCADSRGREGPLSLYKVQHVVSTHGIKPSGHRALRGREVSMPLLKFRLCSSLNIQMRRQGEGKPAFVVHFLIVNEVGGGGEGGLQGSMPTLAGRTNGKERQREGGVRGCSMRGTPKLHGPPPTWFTKCCWR